MKKLFNLFSVVFAMAFTTSAMAQLSIGPRVAVNFSNIAVSNLEEEPDLKSLFGLAFGAAAEVGISETFAFQPEVLFSQHGFATEDSLFGETLELNVRLNYLQIPLLAKFKFGSDAVVVNVVAGPHIGFGIGDITVETEVGGESEKESGPWEDTGFQKFDFGITGGVGVSFAAGPGDLGLDIRYQLGLSNLLDEPEDDEKGTHRNFQVGLSYLIPIGGR